jgi:peptidoglycan-associated lipoprotein
MILVPRGRRGWLNSRGSGFGVVWLAAFGAALVIGGCSSKKNTTGVDGLNNPNGSMTDSSSSGGSLDQFKKTGSLGGDQGPLSDIHFAYNEYTIEAQDGSVLKSNASWLQAHMQSRVQVEGHCDDRGSEEYNIALGAKRAQAARDYLVTLGIAASRISTISYGKELPLCTEHDESCWAQNRRDHFAVTQ